MITLMTTNEVAQKTGLTDRAVRRRIENGQLRAATVQEGLKRTYGVSEQALNSYLKTNKR